MIRAYYDLSLETKTVVIYKYDSVSVGGGVARRRDFAWQPFTTRQISCEKPSLLRSRLGTLWTIAKYMTNYYEECHKRILHIKAFP